MSGDDLGTLLADAEQNGSYFVDVRDRETLDAAAHALGYAVAPIDCAGCSNRDEILARFAQALRFPSWFGGNWDALADCLGDLSWWPADGYLLLLDHIGAWRQDEPDAFATLLEIVDEAASGWSDIGKPFWCVVPLSAQALEDMT
jgi:hypothetical protein